VGVTIREQGIRQLTAGPVASWTRALAGRVKNRAQSLSPVETGLLRRSITAHPPRVAGFHVRATIATATGYGLYPEEGTGIFGPKGRVIKPRTKPFLVFQPRGLGHVIRTRSVLGQKPQHFMRDALTAIVGAL